MLKKGPLGIIWAIMGTWPGMEVTACNKNENSLEELEKALEGHEKPFANVKVDKKKCPYTGENIGKTDYNVVPRKNIVVQDDVPDTAYVEVVVTVQHDLFKKIGQYYENGYKRKIRTPRPISEMELETEIYVRKFMSAVDIKFQPHNNPKIKFHIKNIFMGADMPFIVGEDGLDYVLTREKMREYVDKRYAGSGVL